MSIAPICLLQRFRGESLLGPKVQVETKQHNCEYNTPVDEHMEFRHHDFGILPNNQSVPNDRIEGTQIPTNKPSDFCPENQR